MAAYDFGARVATLDGDEEFAFNVEMDALTFYELGIDAGMLQLTRVDAGGEDADDDVDDLEVRVASGALAGKSVTLLDVSPEDLNNNNFFFDQSSFVIVGDNDASDLDADSDGGANNINGTNFGDYLSGLGGNDVINGLDGKDVVNGDSGNDTLNGGAGNDNINGGSGNDTITWGAGDKLNGSSGTLDSLKIGTANVDLSNNTSNPNSRLSNFEQVDMKAGNRTLKLNATDVLDMSSTSTIKILGDGGDTVNIVGSQKTGGSAPAGFTRYTIGGAILIIDKDIDVM